jgi:hypothetical protein
MTNQPNVPITSVIIDQRLLPGPTVIVGDPSTWAQPTDMLFPKVG